MLRITRKKFHTQEFFKFRESSAKLARALNEAEAEVTEVIARVAKDIGLRLVTPKDLRKEGL